MKINVLVRPSSKTPKLEKINSNFFHIWVKSRPIDGKANQEAQKMLSEYLKIPKTQIRLVMGKKNRNKVFEI